MLDAVTMPSHLAALDSRWEELLDQLHKADENRRSALRVFQEAYARAYIGWAGAVSAEAMRKQVAISQTHDQAAELEHWESEVRFVRDQLRALEQRTSIARSLYAGVKNAAS